MELSHPDESGRSTTKATGNYFVEDCDTVVMCLGCSVNPILASTDKNLHTNKWGVILVNENTCETSKPGVFAAGDAITGGSTVIQAMGQARKAAAGMDEFLKSHVKSKTKMPVAADASYCL